MKERKKEREKEEGVEEENHDAGPVLNRSGNMSILFSTKYTEVERLAPSKSSADPG